MSRQVSCQDVAQESVLEVQGRVVEVLKGCGVATVEPAQGPAVMVNRGTEGAHFDQMKVGQNVQCVVLRRNRMVVHVHQSTMPIEAFPALNPQSRSLDFEV